MGLTPMHYRLMSAGIPGVSVCSTAVEESTEFKYLGLLVCVGRILPA